MEQAHFLFRSRYVSLLTALSLLSALPALAQTSVQSSGQQHLQTPSRAAEAIAVKLDLARLYRGQDQPERALTVLQEALSLAGSSAVLAEIRLELALTLLQLQRRDEAVLELNQAAALNLSPTLLESLAYTERLAGADSAAAGHYRQLITASPERADLWLQLGYTLESGGQPDPEAAREAFLNAWRLYQQRQDFPASLPEDLAYALRRSEAVLAAESAFETLLANQPRPDYLIELASLKLAAEPNQAKSLLNRVPTAGLTLDQLRRLGDLWLSLDEPARTASLLEPLLKLQPNDGLLRLDYALALNASGRDASEAFQQAYLHLQNQKLSPDRLRQLIYGLNLSDNSVEALNLSDQLASQTALTSADWLAQARSLSALGRDTEAVLAYRRASSDKSLLNDVIFGLIELQAWEQALDLLKTRSDAQALALQLDIQLNREELSAAQELLKQLQKQLPSDHPLPALYTAELKLRQTPAPDHLKAARPDALQAFVRYSELTLNQQRRLANLLLNLELLPAARELIMALNQTAEADNNALFSDQVLALRLRGKTEPTTVLSRLQQLEKQAPAEGLLNLAAAAYELKAWPETLRLSQRRLRLQPRDPEALLLSGHASRELGYLGQAESAYRRLIEIKPQSAPARFSLGLVQRAKNQRLEAAESFQAVADDPALGAQAERYQQRMLRERMAINQDLDYSGLLSFSRNDFFLRGSYTSYWLAETRHEIDWRLKPKIQNPGFNTGLSISDQPDWLLRLQLDDGLYTGQSDTWNNFNRFNARAALDMSWLTGDGINRPLNWFLSPSVAYQHSSVLDGSGVQIPRARVGLRGGVQTWPGIRLTAGGELNLGQADLLMGSFDTGGVQLQLEYFPPDMRVGFTTGLQDYLLYDGVGSLRHVQRWFNTLLLDWENDSLIYRGRLDLSPIKGDLEDINLNFEQSLRWLFQPALSGVVSLEVHKYFTEVQRNQSLASVQAGLSWRLPLAQNLPLYLEARARVNSFFDVAEPLRPGFMVFLRTEL